MKRKRQYLKGLHDREGRISLWYATPIFVLSWFLLFQFSRVYLVIPGITFCFLPAGTTFFFVYYFGWRALPLSFIGPFLNSWVTMEAFSSEVFWGSFQLDVRHVICIGGGGLLFRNVQKGEKPLHGLDDALIFTAISSLAGLLSGLWAQAILPDSGHWKDWASALLGFAIGDTNGILLLVPPLMLIRDYAKFKSTDFLQLFYIGMLTVGSTWIAFWVPHIFNESVNIWYPVFVPVLVAGLRMGTAGTSLTLLLVSVVTIFLANNFGLNHSILDLQIFMLTLAVVGYIFAGAGNNHRKALDLLRGNEKDLQNQVKMRTIELEKKTEGLIASKKQIDDLFQYCPVPLLEVDVSDLKEYINSRDTEGLSFLDYLEENPAEVYACAKKMKTLRENQKANTLFSDLRRGFYKSFSEEAKNAYRIGLLAVGEGKPYYSYDAEIYDSAGEIRVLHIQCSSIPSYEEKYERVIMSARDVTKLKQTMEKLEFSESKYRDLFENSTNLVQGVDPDGVVSFANRTWKKVLGFDIGVKMVDFIHPDEINHCMNIFGDLMTGVDHSRVETIFVAKDGREIVVEGNISCRFINGKPHMTRGIFQDITERKRMEETVRMNQEITTASIHNIGNVLNSVNISTELMLEALASSKITSLLQAGLLLKQHSDDLPKFFHDDPKGRMLPEFLIMVIDRIDKEHSFLKKENERLMSKVNLIHKISKPQQRLNRSNAAFILEDFSQIVDDSLDVQISPMHNIDVNKKFKLTKPIKLPLVEISHIFMNLFKNAKEAFVGLDNRRLDVTAWDEGDYLFVTVRDNGVGIDKKHLPSMFRHGFTTKESGHGFGLSYCSRIIKEIGGVISVESDGLGRGATFLLQLPLHFDKAT